MTPLVKHAEEFVYRAIRDGELQIDAQGRIWRVAVRRWNRWKGEVTRHRCVRRRAEHDTGKYLMVSAKYDGLRMNAQASRLIWLHMNGPIPARLTVNHKDGNPKNNAPGNLELATYRGQMLHATRTLKTAHAARQHGERNYMAKLTDADVAIIRRRVTQGELQRVVAQEYGVTQGTVSRIVNYVRRAE